MTNNNAAYTLQEALETEIEGEFEMIIVAKDGTKFIIQARSDGLKTTAEVRNAAYDVDEADSTDCAKMLREK